MSIESLPDYPLLKKLAEALWRSETSYQGAAIMVGSGFSRSAASSGDINSKLPLWNDLLKILSEDLGSDPWGDPLRIAEEYSSYFGKQALRDLIEKTVNDPAWIPSDLYGSLLKLPWAEVLTTNWDTLLERAASDIYKPIYSIVNKPEDLSSSRSPRIVKLHGTVQISHNLIFTQEDYRQYPKTHAAFVNLARQIFIENEFCLLGFSGDDPNFLQWVGWVRDHLASHARRIYLVGALDLSPAKRKYLESINVAPIDLSSLVKHLDNHDQKHREATKMFLNALQILKLKNSWDWKPTKLERKNTQSDENKDIHKNPKYAAHLLENQLDQIIRDRQSYPGWLVSSSMIQSRIRTQINNPHPNSKSLAEMQPDMRAKLLYEIVWRSSVSFSMDPIHFSEELLKVCDSQNDKSLTNQQRTDIALWLFKGTRWLEEDENCNNIKGKTYQILKKASVQSLEIKNEINYHKAILARESFDYLELEKLLQEVEAINPSWMMKKASLLAELGHFDSGEKLLNEAYKALLQQSRKEPNSVYISSHLAWVSYLLQGANHNNRDGIETEPADFIKINSNPFDYLNELRDRLTEAVNKQIKSNSVEPGYIPGHYKDHSKTITFSNKLPLLLSAEGLMNTVGIPVRWDDCNFVTDIMSKLAEMNDIENMQRFSYAVRSASSDTSEILNSTFSRINVARLPQKEVEGLLNRCQVACDYWIDRITTERVGKNRIHYSRSRLNVFIEVLARLVARATPKVAKQVFKWGCNLAKKKNLWTAGMATAYTHLIDYSLKAIPKKEHYELFEDAIKFPLRLEMNIIDHFNNWPNPIVKNIKNRNSQITSRIAQIIDLIDNHESDIFQALERLLPLIISNYLKPSEISKISKKVWGENPKYQEIPDTGFLPFMLLILPCSDKNKVESLAYDYHFKSSSSLDLSYLQSIASGAIKEKVLMLPTETQALSLFNLFTAWEPNKDDDKGSPFGLYNIQHHETEIAKWLGYALSQSIVPSLNKKELNNSNFKKLMKFYEEKKSYEALSSFIYFVTEKRKYAPLIENMIRKSLYTDSIRQTASSIAAVIKWCELDHTEQAKELVKRLIYQINPNRTVGLHILLNAARYLCIHKFLSTRNIESLTEIIPIVFDSTDYINISPTSTQAISFTLVRSACVKLAKEIFKDININDHELKRIIDEAKTDPLPEVRFA